MQYGIDPYCLTPALIHTYIYTYSYIVFHTCIHAYVGLIFTVYTHVHRMRVSSCILASLASFVIVAFAKSTAVVLLGEYH